MQLSFWWQKHVFKRSAGNDYLLARQVKDKVTDVPVDNYIYQHLKKNKINYASSLVAWNQYSNISIKSFES